MYPGEALKTWIEATIEGAAPSEDMSGLNDGDIKRIDARIAAASALLQDKIAAEIARLKPRGWKKALHLLHEWSVLGITATIIVALLALALTQWNAANGRVAAEASFRTHTEDRLTTIETSLLAIRARAVVSNPADSDNQVEAKSLLATAKKESIPLPQAVVEQGGQKFLGASKEDSNAWGVALDFIAYRSSLNTRNPEVATRDYGSTFSTYYHQNTVHGRGPVKWSWGGPLTTDYSKQAKWDTIGHEDKRNTVTQPSWIIGTGGAESLDGQQLRRAILINVEVHFSGGPVILEDVTFINCTFVFDNVAHSRELGERLLAGSSVDYRSGG